MPLSTRHPEQFAESSLLSRITFSAVFAFVTFRNSCHHIQVVNVPSAVSVVPSSVGLFLNSMVSFLSWDFSKKSVFV